MGGGTDFSKGTSAHAIWGPGGQGGPRHDICRERKPPKTDVCRGEEKRLWSRSLCASAWKGRS